MSLRFGALAAVLLLLAGGCTTQAPVYQPVIANIDAASGLRSGVAVGKFEFKDPSLNSVTARADTFLSPVNNSYADYVADAIGKELASAGKLDPKSPKVLTGTIEKNTLNAAGFNTNDAEISIRFRLAGTGYDKPVSVAHSWDSSFMGGIAIPRAMQNWVITLQKVLNKLYSDPQFVEATGKP